MKEKEAVDVSKLGKLLLGKNGFKSFACGCILSDSLLVPTLCPCCYEHESLLSAQRRGDTIMFGKYRGKNLDDVPFDYLVWLNDQDLDEPLKSRVAEKIAAGDFA